MARIRVYKRKYKSSSAYYSPVCDISARVLRKEEIMHISFNEQELFNIFAPYDLAFAYAGKVYRLGKRLLFTPEGVFHSLKEQGEIEV